MKYKNIPIRSKVTEALSRRKRNIDPNSPLRNPGVLDTRRIFVLVNDDGELSDFAGYAFSSWKAADKFLEQQGGDRVGYEISTLYDEMKTITNAMGGY